ncbi:molybdopterin-dependent oxidoreductase [Pyrinomonas sp.]|uniref:molybdopterin-dependent oxidoreductase n=1 Tax=Pyrinomonas sp. TaxID=2080306 RepID=UPI00332D44B0
MASGRDSNRWRSRSFRLRVGGHISRPLELSVENLRRDFEEVSLIAVNQCSGNSCSFFNPRVLGGQWDHGAMGNAYGQGCV